MEKSHSDSEVPYVRIPMVPSEPAVSESQYIYYVIPKESRKKKTCMGSTFCILLLGLTLFLILLPKSPEVFLRKITFNTDGDTTGEFSFRNNNYYDVKWNNPDLTLYWIPYDGQTVGATCYGALGKLEVADSPCDSNKYYDHMCAIKLGEFKSDIKFETKPRTDKERDIQMLTSSQQEQACAAWMILNPYDNLQQRLVTSGHIHAESSIAKFGKVYVKNQYYYL